MPTGIPMNKRNRLRILKGARQILSDKSRWTHGALRRGRNDPETGTRVIDRYCLVGAVAQSARDLGYDVPFRTGSKGAYTLAKEIGLDAAALARGRGTAWAINDGQGYDAAMQLLNDTITEAKAVKPRVPKTD